MCEFHGHHFPYPQRMLRTHRYKLVVNPDSVNELYDLETDPRRAAQPLRPPRAARTSAQQMMRRLYHLLRERGDNFYHWMTSMYDVGEVDYDPTLSGLDETTYHRVGAGGGGTVEAAASSSPRLRRGHGTTAAAEKISLNHGRRPNIVLILTDDHAAHAIGAYGSVVNARRTSTRSPSAGVRFDNCFATNSLCAPSRASILTGTYSHVNGVTTLDTPIDAAQPTFVTPLRGAGLPHGDRRQVAHGRGRRRVDDPQGFDYWDVLIDQGEYCDPRFLSADGVRVEPRATRPTSSPTSRSTGSTRSTATSRGAC